MEKEVLKMQNMAIQESNIEDRRREDSKTPIINKKKKHKDQEDHIDGVQEDPSTTIPSISLQGQSSRIELISSRNRHDINNTI
ncbi:hypothetical protein F8M41_014804 [Gigaspora margarita]|uniref:Uncharacterized protein n=1 Tax=Gigaspora margarita TaxID=4874 RepID=A0A8H4ENU7_GIGMA|nr:hypothetical protein F8M41_014804 [Gigaspora margarita]